MRFQSGYALDVNIVVGKPKLLAVVSGGLVVWWFGSM